jgi:hypothetical protein
METLVEVQAREDTMRARQVNRQRQVVPLLAVVDFSRLV